MSSESLRTAPTSGEREAGAARFVLPASAATPLALLALYLIWGSTYLGIRVAVAHIPPFLMSGGRFLLAGGLLYLFLRMRGVPNPSLREWGGAALVGLLLLATGNGLVGFAETSVASGLAATLIATVPLWATLLAGFWGAWPARWEVIGIVLGFAGVILLNIGSGLHGHPLAAGILVLAAMSWALGSVWSRSLPMPRGLMASAIEMLTGGVLMCLMGVATGERITHLPPASSLWAVAYLVIFGSFVAFSAYNYLLQHVRPTLATSYAYVNPVVAVVLGALLLGEHITVLEVVALLVIVTAVSMVVLGRAVSR